MTLQQRVKSFVDSLTAPKPKMRYIDDTLTACRAHRRFRGIECKGVKIYDVQKVTFSTLFKLYIAELGVLISKRYHMLG